LVRCNVEQREYKVFGYKGKQVRDNIHSEDVASLMYEITRNPRPGEVYNLGGGKGNSCSILEAFQMCEQITGIPQRHTYVDQARAGDHICYYSDLRKIQSHFPEWKLTKSLPVILEEIAASWRDRVSARAGK
jgi:CDP-paratose 2-epimerase